MRRMLGWVGLFASIGAQARDLSNGIVFPSSNSAVIQNPAALGRLKSASFDGAAFVDDGFQGGMLSYVGNVSGGLGAGLDARLLNLYRSHDAYTDYMTRTSGGTFTLGSDSKLWSSRVTASLGFKATSLFTFGLGFDLFPDSDNGIDINAGAQFALSDKLSLGVVFYDVENILSHWAVGLGVDLVDGMVTAEADLDFYGPEKQFKPDFVAFTPALLFSTKKVSLKLAYRAEVKPAVYFPTDSPTLGLSFQFAPNMVFYASYNDVPTKYIFGLKFRH